jgi:hypothetical protein
LSQGISVPAQAFSRTVHSSQSQWSCMALANLSRFRMPSPPRFLDRVVLV